jgi:hypothetical protein
MPILIRKEGRGVGAVVTADGTGVGTVGPLGAAKGTGVSLRALTDKDLKGAIFSGTDMLLITAYCVITMYRIA